MSKAPQPMRHVALCGYVGFDNLGDELILETIVKSLALHAGMPKPLTLTVFSQMPTATKEKLLALIKTLDAKGSLAVRCIHRQDIKAILSTLWSADGFITGGGGLFQDKTGWKSPLYYGGLMLLAKLLGCKTLAYGQGMGPLTTPLGRIFTTLGLNTADTVIIRDAQSHQLAQQLTQTPVIETTDTVWTQFEQNAHSEVLAKKPYTLGISLRPWPSLTEARIRHLAQCIGSGFQQAYPSGTCHVAILPCEPHTDDTVLHAFQQALIQAAPSISVQSISPSEVEKTIAQCQTIVGMRYHAVVLSAKASIPLWGLVYDPKVASVCEALQLPATFIEAIDSLTPEVVAHWLQTPTHPNAAMLAHYQTLANKNVALLAAWLNHQPLTQP